jgi:hypothetical protein
MQTPTIDALAHTGVSECPPSAHSSPARALGPAACDCGGRRSPFQRALHTVIGPHPTVRLDHVPTYPRHLPSNHPCTKSPWRLQMAVPGVPGPQYRISELADLADDFDYTPPFSVLVLPARPFQLSSVFVLPIRHCLPSLTALVSPSPPSHTPTFPHGPPQSCPTTRSTSTAREHL